MSKKYTWYKIADTLAEINFCKEGLAEVMVNDKKVCIGINNKKLFACASKCPHAGGNMSEGYIDALGNIVCPIHRYKFSVINGRNVSGEGYFLKTYAIEEKENGVFIGFEEKGLFNWFK